MGDSYLHYVRYYNQGRRFDLHGLVTVYGNRAVLDSLYDDMGDDARAVLYGYLSNVQAVLSDNRRVYTDISTGKIGWRGASMGSGYDYYPFGMHMRGRYVRDTSYRCMTVTQHKDIAYLWLVTVLPASPVRGGVVVSPGGVGVPDMGGGLSFITGPSDDQFDFSYSFEAVPSASGSVAQVVSLRFGSGGFGNAWLVDGLMVYLYDHEDVLLSMSAAWWDWAGDTGYVSLSYDVPFAQDVTVRFGLVGLLPGAGYFSLDGLHHKELRLRKGDVVVQLCNDNGEGYRFGFNGMHKDNELKGIGNSLDFGARMLDTRIARWFARDPLAGKYPFASPYSFSLNTPIQAVDPDGKVVVFVNGYRGGKAVWKDLNDIAGVRRSIGRSFSSEKLYKKDEFNYWGNMDDKFMSRIGDYNAVYADASSHGLSTATYRYNRGKEAGETMLKQISSGEIKMKTDENGKVVESIKIVSHSQGSAYAAGMSSVLTDAGYNVEVEYNIAPKQPGSIPETKAGRRVQYGSDKDMIAPQSPMKGDVKQGGGPKRDGAVDGHMLENYENAFDAKQGDPGYIAPRQDVKQNGVGVWQMIMLLTMFLGGCKNRKEQLNCLEEYISKSNQDIEYQNLKYSVTDSIKKWTEQELEYTTGYKESNSKWKIDAIIFNQDKSKLFGWILKIDNEQVADIPVEDDRGDILDYVEYFAGEKREGKWFFYIHHMPRIWLARADNNSQPYSFEYLSDKAKSTVIEGGIFKRGTCNVNYSYVTDWIEREDRELFKWHQEFLKSGNDTL